MLSIRNLLGRKTEEELKAEEAKKAELEVAKAAEVAKKAELAAAEVAKKAELEAARQAQIAAIKDKRAHVKAKELAHSAELTDRMLYSRLITIETSDMSDKAKARFQKPKELKALAPLPTKTTEEVLKDRKEKQALLNETNAIVMEKPKPQSVSKDAVKPSMDAFRDHSTGFTHRENPVLGTGIFKSVPRQMVADRLHAELEEKKNYKPVHHNQRRR
jgi:hypothetical protein